MGINLLLLLLLLLLLPGRQVALQCNRCHFASLPSGKGVCPAPHVPSCNNLLVPSLASACLQAPGRARR